MIKNIYSFIFGSAIGSTIYYILTKNIYVSIIGFSIVSIIGILIYSMENKDEVP